MHDRVIITSATDELQGVIDLTLPQMQRYADMVGAHLVVLRGMPAEYQSPKFRMFEAAKVGGRRNLVLDADIWIRDNAPDIFEALPEGNHIFDETEIRPVNMFDVHKAEVNEYAGDAVKFSAHWWSPGVCLLDAAAVKNIYQMPPYDVNECLYTVGPGRRIVKNMPWINYQIAKHGIDITPLDWNWNCFVRGNQCERDAFFWHCAGAECRWNVSSKIELIKKAVMRYESKPGYNLHFVIGTDNWILQRMARAIKEHAPPHVTITSDRRPIDRPGTINYYFPYRGYKGKTRHAKDVAFYTHPEPMCSQAWDKAVSECDYHISMSRRYHDRLIRDGAPADRVATIYPGVDEEYRDARLRVLIPSRVDVLPEYRARKGVDTIERLQGLEWLNVVITNGRMKANELIHEYRAADVIVSTATLEGGPMAMYEALAMGKIFLIRAGVGAGDEIAGTTIYKDDEDLIDALRALYTPKFARAACVDECTWQRWAEEHIAIFDRLMRHEPVGKDLVKTECAHIESMTQSRPVNILTRKKQRPANNLRSFKSRHKKGE